MSFRSLFLASLAGIAILGGVLATPAFAADLFWSANGASQGGAGTWNTADARWGAVAGGPYGTIWDNGNNDTAIFGSTAGAVALGTDITAGGLTFNTTGYSISFGNTLTLAGASTPIINVVTSGHTATINSIIAGADGLQKDGAGTLVIGTAPTYTGATTITGGVFNVSSFTSGSVLSNTSGIAFTTANSTFAASAGGTTTVTYPAMSIASGVTATFAKGSSGNNTPYAIPSLTGGGTFSYTNPGGSGSGTSVTFTTLAGFTGNLQISQNGGSINTPDLNDAASSKILIGGGGSTATNFNYTGSSNLTLNNRQFELNSTANGINAINNNGTASSAFTINTDLAVTATGTKTLQLGGTNAGGTSTFAGNISNGSGTIAVTKVGNAVWVLSGTNTYTGGTTVSAGTLETGASNVLSTGPISVTGGSLQLGAFDHTTGVVTQTGGTIAGSGNLTASRFLLTAGTINTVLAGAGDLYKSGSGTSNLNGANSFTGGVTVGGGTLAVGVAATLGANTAGNSIAINDAGVLQLAAAANSGSNQAITFSSSSKSGAPVSTTGGGAGPVGRLGVLGLGFNGLPTGTISQANTLGGVIAINAVAGYNTDLSALLTGKNLYVGAIGTSTFTGAAGTIVAGNGSLYRLGGGGGQITFNTTNLFTGGSGVQVGSTFVNGGGTVVVQAAQDYTGATTLSQGTLTLSGANGSATGSIGFTLNGGRLFLDSVGAGNNNANRIGAVAVNLSNGGELSLNGNASGTNESFGDLGIGAGYSTVTATAVTANSSLAGAAFSRTANGTALFRGTALGQNAAVMGRVTLSDTTGLSFVGATTLNNAANGDTTKDVRIIPYLVGATTGTGTGDTFVTYDTTTGFRVLNTTNQFNSTITADTNVRLTAAATGIGTNSINSLILNNSGTSTIADGATLTVASGAILGHGGTVSINQAGTTGILDFGSAQGVVTTVSTINIGARITGSGGLVKSGTSQLTLTNANNSFSGGIVINSGTLSALLNANLGDASNTITLNGNAAMVLGNVSYARSIALNNGSILLINNETPTFTGNVTGTGGLAVGIGSGFSAQAVFSGTSNAFEGPILIGGNGSGNANYRMTFGSLADSASANGRIVFTGNAINGGTGSRFEYTGGTGGNTNLALNNRQIELASTVVGPTAGHQIMNSSAGTGTLTIATDLIVSTPIDQTLSLRGTNTGANSFSGVIGNGSARVSLLKTDGGRWILSNANTFSGTTLVSAGILELTNSLALQNSPLDATSSVNGAAAAGLRTTVTTLTIGGLNGTKNLSTLFTTTSGGYGGVTALTLNPGEGVTASYSGVIANGAAAMTLTKTGAGTQILTGANTYTGATTVTAGSLIVNGTLASSSLVVNGSLGGSGVLANATLSGSGSIDPGNSPGIMTALATDPTGGLAYNFEFTAANVDPTWNAPMASVNDVLRLTDATPFTANLDASNVVSVYLDVASITAGDVFTGGFYTDNNLDFLASIEDATFAFYLADPSGSVNYNGLDYDLYTGPNTFTVSTVAKTADFGSGPISGYSTQFLVVPEPATLALLGAGLGLLGLHVARRRKA